MSALAKVAVVTGANKGLGLAFCEKLASDGYRVFGACRGASKAAETPARFAKLLAVPGIELVELDVSDEASRIAAAAAIAARTDRIDLLINNAGVRCTVPLFLYVQLETEESMIRLPQRNHCFKFILYYTKKTRFSSGRARWPTSPRPRSSTRSRSIALVR